VDYIEPLALGHALEERIARDTGVVHQDVDFPDHGNHVVHHLGAAFVVGDVAFGGMHLEAVLAHRAEPLFLAVVTGQAAGDDGVSRKRQPAADRAADATHATGDEHHAARRGGYARTIG